MEAVEYYIIHHAAQAGPYTLEQLRGMIARGEISIDQSGWCEGMADWRPLREILPPMMPQTAAPMPPPLPPRGFAASVQPAPKKKSLTWLWITLGIVLLGMGGCVAVLGLTFSRVFDKIVKDGTDEMAFKPLFEERQNHFPQWRESSFQAAGPADVPDGKVFELIHYQSPGGKMAAYLTPDPKDGKKHPAIVWAHGGFGGIGSYFWEPGGKRNDQSARAFREKGIVMMCPSWRGENDNPGRFELFYNELWDFLSAIEHVKRLPYVDPQRVYIGGHSTGGTMTLLAAVSSDSFRAAFSFGGMIDGVQTLGDGEGYGNTPYDPNSKIDHRLRSPMRYASFIRRPTFYFEGGEYYDEGSAALMELRAMKYFKSFHLPGDHFDILHPITGLIAEKILQDTGTQCNISFTEQELTQRYAAAFSDSLAKHLIQWDKTGKPGTLGETLGKLDADDAVPRIPQDVDAILATAKKIAAGTGETAQTASDMAALAGLRDAIEKEELLSSFDNLALEPMRAWADARLKRTEPFSTEESDSFFGLLSALASSSDERATDLVVTALRQQKLPDTYGWSRVLDAFDEEHSQTEHLMAAFRDDPPTGFAGVLLLDAANQLGLDDWEGPHPFNSTKGAAQLKAWLQNPDPKQSSYAHSAALGAAFIDAKVRGDLIDVALHHPDKAVRMEAAWADVKTGGKQGLDFLKQACLDIHQSARARDYLKELDQEKAVPKEASEPAFAAQAEMSRWLQHPNELGEEPLSIEVYDHKKLFWPPNKDQRDVFLLKFTYKFPEDQAPKTGYGMTGTMTWSFLEEHASPPKPEELYLQHCTLELNRASRSEKSAKDEDNRARALEALQKGNPHIFDAPEPEQAAPSGPK
ncbi:GYF domain-containing protein [Prosthecobacter sp.]|uniref:GYF domain-containing protein n=1 Tax=Prosthecobacter sp. TaxID=1965333 RepID=UPI001D8B7F9D|nr:GYF domain-containing protein [Prosthecobacter sp.]MCB1279197.1 DUF4339 domain-containing protein [Prosthecobacter sp.]